MTSVNILNERIFNFSPGPAVLPVPVLEQIQRDLLVYPGAGMSVMEMSHRSSDFEAIIADAEASLRKVLSIPANYRVIFLQGGASLQFHMVPLNFLPAGQTADYILSGNWAQAAIIEAEKIGKVHLAASTKSTNFDRVPTQADLELLPNAAYVHYTSNNTIFGTETFQEPEVGTVPLICDASSDILSHPLDITKYGLLYAGAQKNMGISGVTVVIVRADLLERAPKGLPAMLDYRLQAEKKSLYNTPPTFSIYVLGLVTKWLLELGGLGELERRNKEKADLLYLAIDQSAGFYKGHAQVQSRSRMNVTFRLANEELEKKFVKEATIHRLDSLKGHRDVGGLRASLYNALPLDAVKALVEFMHDFQKRNG